MVYIAELDTDLASALRASIAHVDRFDEYTFVRNESRESVISKATALKLVLSIKYRD
eukprot:SAG31_NODE_826_length_11751_cov_4.887659_8_plen_57_part_00